jgi:hypothetical protein
MTEGPFTWEWVRKNLDLPRMSDINPKRAGCEQIAAGFNHAAAEYDRVAAELDQAHTREQFGEVWDASPHIFWAASRFPRFGMDPDERRSTAVVSDNKTSKKKQQLQQQLDLYNSVSAMGGVIREVLNDANPNRKPPFGVTRTGPVAKLLAAAFPLITHEPSPGATAISKAIERRPG